jgi:hypothetical protein
MQNLLEKDWQLDNSVAGRPASYSEAVRAHWKEYLMEAAELALSDLAIWHRLMGMFHSLLIIWHSQAADFKFRRSVNTHASSNSPAVRHS